MANISTGGIEVIRQLKNIFKVLGWGNGNLEIYAEQKSPLKM